MPDESNPTLDKIKCLLCGQDYEPVFGPKKGETAYSIYSALGAICVLIKANNPVRVAFKFALGLDGKELAQALEDSLVDCPTGGVFAHDAGERCLKCVKKVEAETRGKPIPKSAAIWDAEKLKPWESKLLAYILEKIETKEDTLQCLIEKFESGKIDAEVYMRGLDSMQYREAAQIAAIQTWGMIQGPGDAFRAAEELELVERYGARIIVCIAQGLEMSSGLSVLNTLSREANNWDGPIQKEIKTYMAKTAGGL